MIEWGKVPWPLWVYVLVGLAAVIGKELVSPIRSPVGAIVAILILLTWDIALLRGVRWVWMLSVGINILFLVINMSFGSHEWFAIAIYLVFPLLLLNPPTRRFFARPK